jgi:hypothetical protein
MRFLSPLALAGLALIALPIVIHLLVRRRAGRIDFPSLRFLRETPSFRLRPRRIQQPLLLALRIAAIALLAFGLARPLFTFGSGTNRLRVIILDASLSMQAAGRTEAARQAARNVVEKMQPGERAAIIVRGVRTETLTGMTSDKAELIGHINSYGRPAGRMNYAEALALAGELLEREPHGDSTQATVDIVSDFQQSGLPASPFAALSAGAMSAAHIAFHPVGAEIGRNAFMSDESVGADKDGPVIMATQITSGTDGRTGVRRVWKINSSEGALPGIEWKSPGNGQVTARIRTLAADEFEWDDERFLVLTPPRNPRVLLIEQSEESESLPYFVAALEAAGKDFTAHDFTVDRRSSLTEASVETANYGLIALMLSRQPRVDEIRLLTEFAANGGTVWLSLGRDVDTGAWNQFLAAEGGVRLPITNLIRAQPPNERPLSLSVVDNDAPALRTMDARSAEAFPSIRMLEGYSFTPRAGAATSVRWNDGAAALVEAAVGRGRIVMFGSSPSRTSGELGTSPVFPSLASSIARTALAPAQSLSVAMGEPVDLQLSPETEVRITDELGVENFAKARDLSANPAEYFMLPGIYRVDAAGITRFLALNYSAEESENQLATTEQIQRAFAKPAEVSKPVAQPSRPGGWYDVYERKGNLWRYLLLAALAVLVTESILAMRTVGHKR